MIKESKFESNVRNLHYGMVGGGEGSFIGDIHRKAAAFDGKCQLIAGCFSRDYNNTLRTGTNLGIAADRLYESFDEMAAKEAGRADGINFVSIVAPNHVHYSAAKAFLSNGINVVCDKPLVFRVDEAEELSELTERNKLLFCVTYTYSGYPMVKQARKLVKDGKIGDILMVVGEYPQDWLISTIENEGQKQAAWRTDPNQSGVSNCIGDLGSHIENTVAYITGLKIKSLCAKLDIIGEGRTLDTNGSIVIKYDNGSSGIYWASQVAIGNDNALKVRIYGTKGSLEWYQENPDYLKVTYLGQPLQIYHRGCRYIDSVASSRIPPGHPEGYYEAFANIYNRFASTLLKKNSGEIFNEDDFDFPNVKDGLEGVKFINSCVKSSKSGAVWVEL
ncbi:MAG: Gfo/Idh/MocA family oxidoreductase [Ruminiclostridium sp.]|nr:Gfo/Idh/MocA family oxidoreductase [Ruminiclostridium sp.]